MREEEKQEILKFEYAVKLAKQRNAIDPDEISSEMVKMLNSENIGNLTTLFNKIYNIKEKSLTNSWNRILSR